MSYSGAGALLPAVLCCAWAAWLVGATTPAMPSASVSPVSTVADQAVPTIVSFETGAREQYITATAAMELRLLVTDTTFFRPDKADGSAILAAGSVAKADAHRSVCGMLVEELWSSDGRGFPYPSGCYYGAESTSRSVTSRTLAIVFESEAGLAPGVRYQIVLKATMRQGVKRGDEVLHLSAIGDTSEVIELGRAMLTVTPAAATSTSSPLLASLTLQPASGSDSVDAGDAAQPLKVKLQGDGTRAVTAQAHLRLVFLPLALWDLGPTCTAVCTPGRVGQLCGAIDSCLGEATVPGQSRNVVHLRLPTSLTNLAGASVTPTVALSGLGRPAQGFFPARMGAQLTDATDSFPQYIESTNTLHRLQASDPSLVASLVVSDGDAKPFRGDLGNEIFVRIAFAATLFSASADGDAKFVITLPSAYTCVGAAGVDATARIFAFDSLPHRRGTLAGTAVVATNDGTWTFSTNTCQYAINHNSAIFGGSVVMLKLTVNNPAGTLLLTSDAHWTLTLSSKGESSGSPLSTSAGSFAVPPSAVVGSGITASLAGLVAVLGKLTDGLAQPSDFTAGADHKVRFFFRAEQSTGLGPSLLVEAPADFSFGAGLCTAEDLDDAGIYGALAPAAAVTQRLPGVVGCTTEGCSGSFGAYIRARISLDGDIVAGARYGFQLHVRNPVGTRLALATLSGWHLTVLASSGAAVDRTAEPLRLSLAGPAGTAWGLYARPILAPERFGIQVSSYRPFSLSAALATVTIFPIRTSTDVTSRLRILAPSGYEWEVAVGTAKYAREAAGALGVPGASADLPGGLPTVASSKSALEWASTNYVATEAYGLFCQIKVPDSTPTDSVNAFFVELGDWTSGDFATRHEAGVVSASDVQALFDASVTPSTAAVGASVALTIQVHTATDIPAGGALLVTSPVGFQPPVACSVETIQVPSGLVADLSCVTASAGSGALEIRTSPATAAVMPKGLYRFRVSVQNPASAASSSASGSTACGVEQCWTLSSLQSSGDPASSLDLHTSIPGFAVHAQMRHAALAPLTDAQRFAIRQSTQPGKASCIVLAMELTSSSGGVAEMVVRAPPGFVFGTDCLAGVHTASAEVFGAASLWPASTYATWPAGATISRCRGKGREARLQVGPGFAAIVRYAWRMAVDVSPSEPTAAENTWALEFNWEASQPFASFILSTFSDAALTPLSTARNTLTPVSLTFRLRTEVPAHGFLGLRAPTDFHFQHVGGACEVELMLLPDAGGESRFHSDRVRCQVDPAFPSVLSVELFTGFKLLAGSKYRLVVLLRNAATEQVAKTWTLQTFSSEATVIANALDESSLLGFPVIPVATLWSVTFANSSSEPQNRGLDFVRLKIWATTSAGLLPGDVLDVTGPSGFSFSKSDGTGCNDYAWDTDVPAGGSVLGTLTGISIACNVPNGFRITYSGVVSVGTGARLALLIDTRNPRVTPASSSNFWRFDHRQGESLVSADLRSGYYIIPQLEVVSVLLKGPMQAAQSTSEVSISFRVVNNCTILRIAAMEPTGFNLANAKLKLASVSDPSGAEFALADADVVRTDLPGRAGFLLPTPSKGWSTSGVNSIVIEARLLEEHTVTFVLQDIKLANIGGQTQWTIETFSGAVELDRRVLAGFRQPGLISVVSRTLKSELDASLPGPNRSASEVDLTSKWTPRVSSWAIAIFSLRFSNLVAASETLVVSTDVDIQLFPEKVQLSTIDKTFGLRLPVAVDVTKSSAGALLVKLKEPLAANMDLALEMAIITASKTSPRGYWRFETQDAAALPTHTNDAQELGFVLVDVIRVGVTTPYAPPAVTFAVNFDFNLGNARPTVLHVLLPPAYTAPVNCTAAAAAAAASCYQRTIVGGRALFLIPKGAASFSGRFSLSALVTSPAMELPQSKAWLVSGSAVPVFDAVPASSAENAVLSLAALGTPGDFQVAWGEDRVGFRIIPLPGVVAEYASVALTTVYLALSFKVAWRGALAPRALQLLPPDSYELICDPRFLRLISLPRNASTCSIDPFTLALADGQSFPEGNHTFILGVRVPRETPVIAGSSQLGSYFRMLLLEDAEPSPNSMVVDSNMMVEAIPVQSLLLRVQQPTMSWTFSRPSSQPYITFRVKLERSLPAGKFIPFAAVLIQLPEGFSHVITTPADVVNLNTGFPLALAAQWAEYDTFTSVGSYFGTDPTMRKVRILRNESRGVPAGVHGWAFPVSIPLEMPVENIWRLSLCGVRSCTSTDKAEVLTSFVLPGFLHDEVSVIAGYSPDVVHSSARGIIRVASLRRAVLLVVGAAAAAATGARC